MTFDLLSKSGSTCLVVATLIDCCDSPTNSHCCARSYAVVFYRWMRKSYFTSLGLLIRAPPLSATLVKGTSNAAHAAKFIHELRSWTEAMDPIMNTAFQSPPCSTAS